MRCNEDELCIRYQLDYNSQSNNSHFLAISNTQKLEIYLISKKALLQILGVSNQVIEQHNYLGIAEHMSQRN